MKQIIDLNELRRNEGMINYVIIKSERKRRTSEQQRHETNRKQKDQTGKELNEL